MRIYRDIELVEQLGSGIPRVLQAYQPSIYHFSPNFIRITFLFEEGFEASDQATVQATTQVEKVLLYCIEPRSRLEIQEHLGLKHREHLRKSILSPLLQSGQLLLTLPDKPSSPKQRFYTAQPQQDKNRASKANGKLSIRRRH